jgi:WD40 repeat protein
MASWLRSAAATTASEPSRSDGTRSGLHGSSRGLGAWHRLFRGRPIDLLGQPRHDGQDDGRGDSALRGERHDSHPGVLRGGQLAIRRHPVRNELLVGSSDGVPKLFQMDVKAAPASGGNPNQIREYDALPGRVFDVCFHPDGSRVYAGSSLDGSGRLRCFETDTGQRLWDVPVAETGIYAIACSPDGATLAAAGSDGQIRLLDAASGQAQAVWMPFAIQARDGWATRLGQCLLSPNRHSQSRNVADRTATLDRVSSGTVGDPHR